MHYTPNSTHIAALKRKLLSNDFSSPGGHTQFNVLVCTTDKAPLHYNDAYKLLIKWFEADRDLGVVGLPTAVTTQCYPCFSLNRVAEINSKPMYIMTTGGATSYIGATIYVTPSLPSPLAKVNLPS